MVNFQRMDRYDINDLRRIMELLRSPEGCPWDKVQTHQSIRRDMLEEAYEVAEAIDNQDFDNLKEELGDVLFEVASHAEIGRRTGEFDIIDVTTAICRKMIHRRLQGSVP